MFKRFVQVTPIVALMSALMFIGSNVEASPYIEYKHKYDLTIKEKKDDYIRVGYKVNKVYAEVGQDSAEVGYKFKASGLTVKGKVESTNDFEKTSLETEIRYTFQK